MAHRKATAAIDGVRLDFGGRRETATYSGKDDLMKTPTCEYVSVTPDQATEWLNKAAKNRKISQRRVGLYAAAMRRGDWMLTNQGIAIDEFGYLIDGQHRLQAVVEAQTPVVLLVIRATPNKSQLVLDQGLKRLPHDQVGLREGWELTPLHMAVAKSMVSGIGGAGETERRAIIADIQQMDRFYVRHHKAIEFAVAQFASRQKVKGVTIAPVLAPVARAHYSTDQNKLVRFCEVVATGMADRKGDGPAVVLRNWLLAGRDKALSSRSGKDRYAIYKKTEIALDAFLANEPIQRLGQMNLDAELYVIPGDIRVVKKAKAA
jgi:hypothetical protein